VSVGSAATGVNGALGCGSVPAKVETALQGLWRYAPEAGVVSTDSSCNLMCCANPKNGVDLNPIRRNSVLTVNEVVKHNSPHQYGNRLWKANRCPPRSAKRAYNPAAHQCQSVREGGVCDAGGIWQLSNNRF
jgi:hypothetical protein